VAYPAAPHVTSRVRFRVNAAHTKEDIDTILKACDEIGDVDLKHDIRKDRWSTEKVVAGAVQLGKGKL